MKFVYSPKCWIESRSTFAKLKVSLRKTNMKQKSLSCSGHSLWNNLPGPMKKPNVLNTFKHNLKKKFLGNLAGSYRINRVIIGTHLYSLPTHLFVYILIYLFVYLFVLPLSHFFSLLFLTFVWPFYHFLYLLSQSILYDSCIHLVISLYS